jgi:putative sterol carrier protein
MKYWKDETEPVKAFVTLWETLSKEDEFIEGMKKVNQLIWFDYTEDGPNCSFHVDGRDGKFIVKAGKPDEAPDLTMSLTADNAHLSWANKLNPVMAITRGQIKVKGSATGLLKLAPKLKKVAVYYEQILRDFGWADKLAIK